jgi:anaerobic magnesium-protoporphyrin IX monomethyl ester cyclase
MKILMLNPPFHPRFSRPQRSPAVIKSGTLYYPIWLSYATGLLESAGYDVKLIDAPAEGYGIEVVKAMVKDFGPIMTVLDTSTPSIFSDVKVAEVLKEVQPESFVILVGTHVSATPEESLGFSQSVNAIARREYDHTLLDLADLIRAEGVRPELGKLEAIKGLSFKSDGQIIHNPDRPFIKDLDVFPFVSEIYKRHLKVENYFYSITQYPEITIVTGRGCPHRCNYCVYPQTMFGHLFRHRSPENVMEEFKYIKENFPQVKEIFIEDDTLTVNRGYCQRLCQLLIKERVHITWTANSRADIDFETLKLMKEAGCRLLCIGVESGSQHILDSIQKKLRLEQVEAFMKDARRAKILVHACFMVGNAGETKETMKQTLDFAKKLKPDTAQFFPLMVYPGTQAFDWAKQHGYLTATDYSKWLTKDGLHNCIVSTPEVSNEELVSFCDYARRSFYLRPTYMLSKVSQIMTHPSEATRIVKAARTFFRYLFKGSDSGFAEDKAKHCRHQH